MLFGAALLMLVYRFVVAVCLKNEPNFLAVILAAVYGAVRGGACYPDPFLKHLRWLFVTPWSPSRRLPFGVRGLIPHDFVMLAMLIPALSMDFRSSIIGVCLPALMFYLLSQTVWAICFCLLRPEDILSNAPNKILVRMEIGDALLRMKGAGVGVWLLFMCFGLFFLKTPWHRYWVMCVAGAMLPLVWTVQRRAFDRLWRAMAGHVLSREDGILPVTTIDLAGKADYPSVGFRDAILWSVLPAWYVFVIMRLAESSLEPVFLFFFILVNLFVAIMRLGAYCYTSCNTPHLLERLVMRRLVLPRADVVWVGPIAVLLFGFLARACLQHIAMQPWSMALAIFGTFFVAMMTGPTIRDWRLTGMMSMPRAAGVSRFSQRTGSRRPRATAATPELHITIPGLQRLTSRGTFFDRYIDSRLIAGWVALVVGALLLRAGAARGAQWGSRACVLLSLGFLGFSGICCFITWIERVRLFHPLVREDSMQFLENSPWERGKPFPLGPVHLVWRDLPMLALAGAVPIAAVWAAAGLHVVPPHRLILFCSSVMLLVMSIYLASLAWLLLHTGQKETVLMLCFIPGLCLMVAPNPSCLALVALVAYFLAYTGLRNSLTGFPWTEGRRWIAQRKAVMRGELPTDMARVGFLRSYLAGGEVVISEWFSLRDRVMLVALAAWSFAAVLIRIDAQQATGFGWVFGSLAVLMCSLGRLLIYTRHLAGPIGLLGRVFSWHWIVPEYDRVIVAPLLGLVTWVALGGCATWFPIPAFIGFPVALLTAFWVIVSGRPSLRDWRLTCQCRVRNPEVRARVQVTLSRRQAALARQAR